MDVKAKYESGQPIKAIARETGISRNTVRKMVRGKHQGTYTRKEPEKRILDEFEPYLRQNWQERNAHLLYEDITSMGYAGSEVTVRRFRARLKREHGLVAAPSSASRPRRASRPRSIGAKSAGSRTTPAGCANCTSSSTCSDTAATRTRSSRCQPPAEIFTKF